MKFEKMFQLSAEKLKKTLRNELSDKGYKCVNNNKFLYAKGDAPVMLVAHLDTVHTKLPSIICYSKDLNYMMSPTGIGGDDRCGVYIIMSLLNHLPFSPHVLFTMDEEIGGVGADEFVKYAEQNPINGLKYIVEFDRKGNDDCVFYSCGNQKFTDFVEQFGFKKSYGTFSDISVIAPALGVAAVNLSSGYYNPHTEHEYVSIKDMNEIVSKSIKMLCTECDAFEYIRAYSYGSWNGKISAYSKYSSYYDSEGYDYECYVNVTFIPKGTVQVYSYILKGYVINEDYEVAVDKLGNYYKYTSYGDLVKGAIVQPVDGMDAPKFDENNSVTVPVYF